WAAATVGGTLQSPNTTNPTIDRAATPPAIASILPRRSACADGSGPGSTRVGRTGGGGGSFGVGDDGCFTAEIASLSSSENRPALWMRLLRSFRKPIVTTRSVAAWAFVSGGTLARTCLSIV